MIKKILFLSLALIVLFSLNANAAETANPSYFQGLWDFIDWIYDGYKGFKNSFVGFLADITALGFLWWLKMKIEVLTLVWSIVEPIIDQLNLTDVILAQFGGLKQDWQVFINQIRLGEGINILISAQVTRLLLNIIGW